MILQKEKIMHEESLPNKRRILKKEKRKGARIKKEKR
jgi:hypothetical protein